MNCRRAAALTIAAGLLGGCSTTAGPGSGLVPTTEPAAATVTYDAPTTTEPPPVDLETDDPEITEPPVTTPAAPRPTAAPRPAATARPAPRRTTQPTPPPPPRPRTTAPRPPQAVYYPNCAAARAAGAAPLHRGDPGYRPGLDRDGDGIACE